MKYYYRSALTLFVGRILPILALSLLSLTAQAADHWVSSDTSSVDCARFNGGVRPGDTITLAGGPRGPLSFYNCVGQDTARIKIRNDPRASSPTTIRGNSSFLLQCTDCRNVDFDGTGGWAGKPWGAYCGVDKGGKSGCGIVVRAAGTNVTAVVKMYGTSTKYSIKGLEVDGGYPTFNGAPALGIDTNDHSICTFDHPGLWREDITIAQNFVHNTHNSGMYVGPNWTAGKHCGDDVVRLRDIEIKENLMVNLGFGGISLKSAIQGRNLVHHNYIVRTGTNTEDGWDTVYKGITCYESTCDIYSNWIEDAGEHGIQVRTQDIPASFGTMHSNVYNNVIISPGRKLSGFMAGHGITVSRRGSAYADIATAIYNNTIYRAEASGINVGGGLHSVVIRDNISVGSGDRDITNDSAGFVANNAVGAVSSIGFVDPTNLDFSLSESSSLIDTSGGREKPAEDFHRRARPQGQGLDPGAIEFGTAALPKPPKLVSW